MTIAEALDMVDAARDAYATHVAERSAEGYETVSFDEFIGRVDPVQDAFDRWMDRWEEDEWDLH